MNHDTMPLSELVTSQHDETAQIEEHKYFLSEKAGYDVGWEFAEQDWRENFAEQSLMVDAAHTNPSTPRGLGGFFKRLLSKAAV